MNVTDKTGALVAIKAVTDKDHLMIITKEGITIRMEVMKLRVMGRVTQGVRLIKLSDEDDIASVAMFEEPEDAIPGIEGTQEESGETQTPETSEE